MRLRRILILSNQSLFAQAVRNLVEMDGRVKVIGIMAYDDNTVRRLKALRPNIIVLGDEKDLPSTVLPTLLDAVPGVRIIRLTLDGNVIRVYDCFYMIAHQANDLVDAFDLLFDRSVSGKIPSAYAPANIPALKKNVNVSPTTKPGTLTSAKLANSRRRIRAKRARPSRKEGMPQH